jgi:signal transduction histidine kinase
MGMIQPLPHHGLLEFSVLAHELKQPLMAILSNAQAAQRLLTMATPDLTEVGAAVDDIIAAARRTDEMIQRLQAFITTGALERSRLSINDVIREVMQLMCGDAATHHIRITLDLAADLPPVHGDRIQLRQVLLNVVRNAFEAMYLVADRTPTLVVHTAAKPTGVITVTVQDCGRGIDEASMARLFHPFFTTKAGGMGLGLALSRSIIAAHGGWIWASRNPEQGLTVSFTLPAG